MPDDQATRRSARLTLPSSSNCAKVDAFRYGKNNKPLSNVAKLASNSHGKRTQEPALIQAKNLVEPYQTAFSNGTYESIADVSIAKGGGGLGFGPHELLEAALATCVTMTVQMAAQKHGFPLEGAQCTARLDRSQPERIQLHYTLTLDGPALRPEQHAALHASAARCPVAQTLSGGIACCASSP